MIERIPNTPPIIDRLRAENPVRNVAAVAVEQLDQPAEMTQFIFQYAQELGRTSEIPETRANPFDSAIMLLNRIATSYGGEIAGRWYELIDTGTVQEVPDHSMDWLNPKKA